MRRRRARRKRNQDSLPSGARNPLLFLYVHTASRTTNHSHAIGTRTRTRTRRSVPSSPLGNAILSAKQNDRRQRARYELLESKPRDTNRSRVPFLQYFCVFEALLLSRCFAFGYVCFECYSVFVVFEVVYCGSARVWKMLSLGCRCGLIAEAS